MPIRVHIGGSVCPPEEAKVSVFDRGFLYGDSVYETIGTAYGRLFAARDHLYRLERSAERIGLRAPPRATVERAIADTMAAAGFPESRVRVILTRGAGKLDRRDQRILHVNLEIIFLAVAHRLVVNDVYLLQVIARDAIVKEQGGCLI